MGLTGACERSTQYNWPWRWISIRRLRFQYWFHRINGYALCQRFADVRQLIQRIQDWFSKSELLNSGAAALA